MIASIDLSPVQIDALASMHALLGGDRWSLIGASAIRCRIEMPRPTMDVDFAVLASSQTLEPRLEGAGWKRHPKKLQTWLLAGAQIDVVSVTDEDLLAGVAVLGDGFELSVIGFDLAFQEVDSIEIRSGLVVPVPRLPVLVLLKMVAWLERPHQRQKDLGDIVLIWDEALPVDDERRWDPNQPVFAAGLEHEDQSAFFCGWELGRIAGPEHSHWAKRFLDAMRGPESAQFAQLVDATRYAGDDAEARVRRRLIAFERGLQIGVARPPLQRPAPARPIVQSTPAATLVWGCSGSLQMVLHDAIDQRRVIRFSYQGRVRVAEPHVLGMKDDRLALLTWQTDGASSSGPLPEWRRFFVDQISDLEVTGTTFAGSKLTRGRHSAFDRQIVVVR